MDYREALCRLISTNCDGCIIESESDCRRCQEAEDMLEELVKKADRFNWIPVTAREITEEERVEIYFDAPEDMTHVFTCPLPDDGDEILISQNNGEWVSATVFCNDNYGVGDEHGNDWLYEVDAWMPMPKGYVKSEV